MKKMALHVMTTSKGELVFENEDRKKLHVGKTVKEHAYMMYVQHMYTHHGLTGLWETYQTIQRMISAKHGPPMEDLLQIREIVFHVIFGI